MADDFYARMRATASRLVGSRGVAVTLTDDEGTGQVDPDTGAWQAGTASSYPATAVIFPAKEVRRVGLAEGTDAVAFVEADDLSVRPRVGWTLMLGGDVYQVLDVERLSPAGTDVMYTLMLGE